VLTIAATSSATPGTRTLTVAATGGGIAAALPLAVTVPNPPAFSLSVGAAAVTISPGGMIPLSVTVNLDAGFTSSVGLSLSGLAQRRGRHFLAGHRLRLRRPDQHAHAERGLKRPADLDNSDHLGHRRGPRPDVSLGAQNSGRKVIARPPPRIADSAAGVNAMMMASVINC